MFCNYLLRVQENVVLAQSVQSSCRIQWQSFINQCISVETTAMILQKKENFS
jgi:hypothetical protein